jgi:hypothetical protein
MVRRQKLWKSQRLEEHQNIMLEFTEKWLSYHIQIFEEYKIWGGKMQEKKHKILFFGWFSVRYLCSPLRIAPNVNDYKDRFGYLNEKYFSWR